MRSEALEGRWMSKRRRDAQLMVVRSDGRFRRIDLDAAREIARLQREKGERGDVPWLDPGELLTAVCDPILTPA